MPFSGWSEEIVLAVLLLTYFIEKPFQNLTRTTADLLGVVMLYADYRLPVEEARQELHRILDSSDLWDKKASALQVTDATEKTIQLRALMSASNGPRLFDLRCYVREMMIRYLESKHPEFLPLSRQEIVVMRGKCETEGARTGAFQPHDFFYALEKANNSQVLSKGGGRRAA